jgi:uncharacterized RDD family membrane protein YckC
VGHEPAVARRLQLADWGTRAAAALLDAIVVCVLAIIAGIATVSLSAVFGDLGGSFWWLLTPLFAVAYYCRTMTRSGRYNGQTPNPSAACATR